MKAVNMYVKNALKASVASGGLKQVFVLLLFVFVLF